MPPPLRRRPGTPRCASRLSFVRIFTLYDFAQTTNTPVLRICDDILLDIEIVEHLEIGI